MTKLTRHGKQRGKQRLGLNAKAVKRMASIALELGLDHSETKGNLRGYLDKLGMQHPNFDKLKVYGEHIYLFGREDALITVLYVPVDLRTLCNKLQDKRKNG